MAVIAATADAGSFAAFLMFSVVKPTVGVLGALTGVRGVGGVFGPGGTPAWNPQAGTGLGSSRWRDFVFHLQEEIIDVGKSSESTSTPAATAIAIRIVALGWRG